MNNDIPSMNYKMDVFQPSVRSYFSTASELSPSFNNGSSEIQIITSAFDPNNQLIIADKRDVIIRFAVDRVRGFNYFKIEKRYRPYNISKDAYDLNFYNYGFKEI